jgi:hypothetical protein
MHYLGSHAAGETLAAGIFLNRGSIGTRHVNNINPFIKQSKARPSHERRDFCRSVKFERDGQTRGCFLRFRRFAPVIKKRICPRAKNYTRHDLLQPIALWKTRQSLTTNVLIIAKTFSTANFGNVSCSGRCDNVSGWYPEIKLHILTDVRTVSLDRSCRHRTMTPNKSIADYNKIWQERK